MKKILLFTLLFPACLLQLVGQIPLASEKVMVTNEWRVNSDELEFSPVFYKEGIVFITTRFEAVSKNIKDKNIGNKNIMSIYHSERNEEGYLQEPTPLANELIFRLHEGPVTFDKTASYIFFTRNESAEQAADGYKKLQIYGAHKVGEVWEDIQKLPFNNVGFNYCHPTLSADEDVLFVSSDIPGGYGGMDLYSVAKKDGLWSEMTNLGPAVNTSDNEVFPYIAADGTLYFSSDGHGGFGGLDLFYTNQRYGEWRGPVNLEYPFNSPNDDVSIIVDRDNKNGYFSSDRKGGFGGDDIYSFHIEGDIRAIAQDDQNLDGIVVKDEDGNPMEGVTVSAINFDEVSLGAGDQRVVKLSPNGDGKDNFTLDVNSEGLGQSTETGQDGRPDLTVKGGNYVVKVAKEGYVPEYVVVTPETDLNNLGITLRRAVNCIALVGEVRRDNGRLPVGGAKVYIVDVETKQSITVYSDDRGYFDYCVPCDRSYTVYAEKDDVSSAPVIANAKDLVCKEGNQMNVVLNIYGTPFFAGMTIRLPNIYFNFDDAALRPDAYKDLNEVVGMLNRYPGMKLELGSHTDSRGVAVYNLDLSQRRSASVKKYLVSQGIEGDRLTPRGYGESQLRNRCADGVACSETEHQYNRCTEIKILEMGEEQASQPIAVQDENFDESGLNSVADKGGQDLTDPDKIEATPEEKDYSMEGAFAVIAGTFANHENAERRASLLMDMGYSKSGIVKQASNGLYAVWVNTYDDKKEAFSLVGKLASKQLSAYVLRR